LPRRYKQAMWIGVFAGLLSFIAVTLLSDVSQLAKYVRSFPWVVMLPVLALRVGNWAIRCAKWFFLLRLVGVRNLSVRDGVSTFIAGLAMAISPGKLAEFIKCFIVKNLTGAPVPTTIPTILAERVTDGAAVVLLLVLSIAATAKPEYLPGVALGIASNVALLSVLAYRPLCLFILRLVERFPLLRRFVGAFRTLYESSYILFRPRNYLTAVSTGLASSTLDGIGMWIILVALGQPPTMQTFFVGLLAICLSVVTGSISGMPGGAGVSDLTIAGVLIFQLGLAPSEAGFATLLARFTQSWWGVLVGLAVAVLDRKRLFPPALATLIEAEDRALANPAAV